MHLAPRQVPDKPGIHGAEGQLARLGPRAHAVHIVEDPGQFRAAEIRVQQQAGAVGHDVFEAFGLEALAVIGGATVLPDDGVEHRLAGGAVPDQRGFALVGDADGGNLVGPDRGLLDRGAAGGGSCGPEVGRVMFDPTALRVVLGEFLLRRGDDGQAGVEQNGTGRGGALINGKDMGAWGGPPGGPVPRFRPGDRLSDVGSPHSTAWRAGVKPGRGQRHSAALRHGTRCAAIQRSKAAI